MKNIQGDVIALVKESGTVTATYKYDAWGNLLSYTGGGAALANPFRYRSYYYDIETGLYYVSSRYYDPETCRFINADGILGANGDINAYNLFTYCSNNPVAFSDPSGRSIVDTIKSIFGKNWKIVSASKPITKHGRRPNLGFFKKVISKSVSKVNGLRDLVDIIPEFDSWKEVHAYNMISVGTGHADKVVGDFSQEEREKYVKRCEHAYMSFDCCTYGTKHKYLMGMTWDEMSTDDHEWIVGKIRFWDELSYRDKLYQSMVNSLKIGAGIVYD